MTAPTLADEVFGTDLYRLLAGTAPDLVFSPVSVAAALRLALLGARGQTAAELAAALHLAGPDQAPDGLRQLDALVAGSPADVTFLVANTAWVQAGLPLLPRFTALLDASASSAVTSIDFASAPERAREQINVAVAAQTEGKITALLDPGTIGASTRLVLANAVYLKAPWADPFPHRATETAPFHPRPGQSVPVPVMHGTARRDYVRGQGYQAVLLPYLASTLAMAIIVPDGPLAALAARPASTLLDGATAHQVTLSLPRFRVEAKIDLGPALRELGVRAAFGGSADFAGVTSAARLQLAAAVHQAYLDVDEHGTEAAAATALTMRAMAIRKPPPAAEMVVDRPFLFAIIDTASGSPLFLGQVTNPGRS